MSNAVASSVGTGHWTETTLGGIAEYITSGSRDWSKYYADSGAIFIRTQDINKNRLSINDVAFVKLPQKVEGKRSLVRKGDLLITITGANVGKVAIVEAEIPEAYVSQSVCLVRLKDPSIAKFIHLQLISKRGEKTAVEAMAYGLGRPVLNLENIRSAPIRLAPSNVQAVIVAEIEKQFSRLDEAIASLKRTKANLKRYKAAVLKAAVEGKLTEDWRKQHPDIEPASKLLDRILAERRAKWSGKAKCKEPTAPDTTILPTLPKGWVWASLEQLSWDSSYGTSVKCSYESSGPPVLRIPNIVSGKLALGDLKFALKSCEIEQGEELSIGDVLIIRTNGSRSLIGRCAVVRQPLPSRSTYASYLIRFRLLQLSETIAWVSTVWDADFFRQWIEQRAATSAGQHNISMTVLATLPIPLPPLAELGQIVSEVERRLSVIEEIEAAVQTNLTRADRLRQSILHRAFCGEFTLEPRFPEFSFVGEGNSRL